MDDINKRINALKSEVSSTTKQLGLQEIKKELEQLRVDSVASDFWSNAAKAQTASKRQAALEQRIKPWEELRKELSDIEELAGLKDDSVKDDLTVQLEKLEKEYSGLKEQLKLTGPYDDHSAILSIFAGAGGTDAQDWAQMLLRMYLRYCEKAGFSTKTIEESAGEEAGLKSVTVEVDGDFAYGQLKGEHGVHRLVRLSPFNSDHLRQTSFAKVDVLPKVDKPDEVEIDEKDLKIDVYRSGGHGGQSVNTTDSAVRVTHNPTGITVAIQNERSQLQNKDTALTILRSRLAQLQLEQHKVHVNELKGPNQSAEWGSQIRSYVLHPYKQVKDLRTNFESSDPDKVLGGDLVDFINAYLEQNLQA